MLEMYFLPFICNLQFKMLSVGTNFVINGIPTILCLYLFCGIFAVNIMSGLLGVWIHY